MSTLIHSRRGQTLVEALVALSILTMGFIGIISLLSRSFQLNRTASDDTQATYLAAEGIEVAKSIIDYDVYSAFATDPNNIGWGCSFGLTPGAPPTDFALAYDTNPGLCPAEPQTVAQVGDKLYFDSNADAGAGFYTYNNFYTSTDFTRDVYLSTPLNSPNEIDVRSVVTWTNGPLSNTITLQDSFYNWHP